MAQLHAKPYTFDAGKTSSFMDVMNAQDVELRRLQAAAEALDPDALVGKLIDFPVADGKAVYLVTSEKPLVLQHVPFFDAYRIDAAMIRGLRADDVRRLVKQKAGWKALFAQRAPAKAA